MKYVLVIGGVVVAVGILVIAVLSLVGMSYLTQYSFSSDKVDGQYCVKMTETQRNLTRMGVIFVWITLALIIVSSILNLVMGTMSPGELCQMCGVRAPPRAFPFRAN